MNDLESRLVVLFSVQVRIFEQSLSSSLKRSGTTGQFVD